MRKIIPIILLLLGLCESAYSYGPYKNGYIDDATNICDCTSYVLDMGILKMAEYRMLENDSGHQFLFRGKTVPELIDSSFISMNDSNYLLITMPENIRFREIAPYCEVESTSLLRTVSLMEEQTFRMLATDTLTIHTRTDRYFEFQYNNPPDYFLVFLIKGNAFNNFINKGVSLGFIEDTSKKRDLLDQLQARPRTYKDSSAYYRFILPVWTKAFVNVKDFMPCIEDD